MASAADTRAAALLVAFSAALLLLQQPRGALADLLLPALHRFASGRGLLLLGLATRTNMILLCHAILLLILRDAGLLGAPGEEAGACSVPATLAATPRPHAVRNSAASAALTRDDELPVDLDTKQKQVIAAREEESVDTKQMIFDLMDKEKPGAACWEDAYYQLPGGRDRAASATVPVDDERPALDDGNRSAVDTEQQAAEMELADDRAFEEFIRSQRRKMRQESLRLVSRSGSGRRQVHAIAAC